MTQYKQLSFEEFNKNPNQHTHIRIIEKPIDRETGDLNQNYLDFVEKLKTNKTVTCLDLSFCRMVWEGFDRLCDGLMENTTIKKLILYANMICDLGKYLRF